MHHTAPVTVSNGQVATNKMCGTTVIAINCSITTNNVLIHSHNIKDGNMQLAVGVPSLHETVTGLELQLPAVKNFRNTIHGAEMLCQALEELLPPSKKTTVLDIVCGIGLLGLYLSKVCIACSICLVVCFCLLKYCRGKEGWSSSSPSSSYITTTRTTTTTTNITTATTTTTTTTIATAAATITIMAHGSAVGLSTALQARRSWV